MREGLKPAMVSARLFVFLCYPHLSATLASLFCLGWLSNVFVSQLQPPRLHYEISFIYTMTNIASRIGLWKESFDRLILGFFPSFLGALPPTAKDSSNEDTSIETHRKSHARSALPCHRLSPKWDVMWVDV
jgi:hypothetical protein